MGETYPRSYGAYVLLERLGSGGMSEVDLARRSIDDGSFVRFAVIKRIKADRTSDPSFVRMFKDEARITSELHHEKIGSVYDFGKVGDEYYLALEYVPGIDGRHLVNVLRERGQRVPVRVALKIVVDVLEALQYAHFKKDTFGRPMGIVHRDVNPRNVMLSIRGEVKLIDFGVAKATDRLERTRTDHVKGKFAYMAPEQISGVSIDHRTDLYAVGLLMHELLTGVSPFYGLNQVQILHRMVNASVDPLPPVPELPDDSKLRAVHDRSLAADPDRRYQSAAEFAADLRAVADAIGGIPTDDQLASFLRNVEPDLATRLESKMEGYAKLGATDPEMQAFRAPTPAEETLSGQDLSKSSPSAIRMREMLAPGDLSGTLTVARTGVLAGSVMLVSVASALIAAAVVVAVLFIAYLATGGFGQGGSAQLPPIDPRPSAETQPKPVLSVGIQPDSAPVPAPTSPGPQPAAPQPAEPQPAAPQPAAPQPAAPQPAEPQPAAPQPVEPVIPDPVVIPDPQPALDPQPAPDPKPPSDPDFGILQVTAPEKGLKVRANGDIVGDTPLRSPKFPVGSYTIEVSGYTCAPRSASVQKDRVTIVTCK